VGGPLYHPFTLQRSTFNPLQLQQGQQKASDDGKFV